MSTQTVDRRANARPVPFRRLAIAGITSIAAAIIANLLARLVLFAVMDLPRDFLSLTPGPIIFFTVIGTFLGVVVYGLITRFSINPARTYIIVAIIALVLSVVPNLALMANPAAGPIPGGTSLAFAALMVLHVVAAVVSVTVLLWLVRE